jgi:hypothetical protein
LFSHSNIDEVVMSRVLAILISPFNNSSKGKKQWKPSKIRTSNNVVILAFATSHAFRFTHICIMKGLYSTNTLFTWNNIDNHYVFTFWRIFKPFTSNKEANLSSYQIEKSKNIPQQGFSQCYPPMSRRIKFSQPSMSCHKTMDRHRNWNHVMFNDLSGCTHR